MTLRKVTFNDGRVYRVDSVEPWALGTGRLVILEGMGQTPVAIRNIASIGTPTVRRRRRRA